ncbi:VCBS repeat-containing protein [Dysosmobacter sp. NSJ-60]|nr:VCBS repeat-containing protein [Dysosmobacter hominis]
MIFLASMLSGCTIPKLTLNSEDLYSLPTLPAKYTELNTQLNEILESGAEYAAPTSGANIQSVQLVDLDGDGREEAVAFFRNAAEEKPLKIYIFTATEDSYQKTELIEGSGTGIYSIAYTDLDGDGRMELLVGWKATTELQVLEVYALRPGGAALLVRSDYVKYTAMDLDQDQRQELVVLHADEGGDGVADYYSWQEDGSLASQSSARLSVTMAELNQQGRVTQGKLQEEVPALFVTGVTDASRAVTDILSVRNGELTNVVLSDLTGVSGEIAPFCSLYPSDINNDGLTEVPSPIQVSSMMETGAAYQRVDWYAYNAGGQSSLALHTYHDVEDRWYLRLPEEWLNHIWVGRATMPDEAAVTFYILDGEAMEPFLRITAITGSSRENRAVRGGRFLLSRQSEVIYTAELLDANDTWQYGVTADEVREAFSLITSEWSAGDY